MTDDARFKEIIKERLTERRYNHSLCVADSAKSLAKKYGADENKAYTAGLLHDVFKDAKKEEQLAYIAENNIELSKTELHTPKLYHAICGAHYIKHTLGVCDPEIISAVRYHTTGRGGMPLFEKVLFVADYISADRTYPGVDVMREKAECSLDEAIVFGIAFTVKELIDEGKCVHTDTVNAYNDAILEMKGRL